MSITYSSQSDSGQLAEDCVWIQTTEQLNGLADRLREAAWLAFDTESNSMYAYQERVCLIQLNIDGLLCVLDPFLFTLGRGPLAHSSKPSKTLNYPFMSMGVNTTVW